MHPAPGDDFRPSDARNLFGLLASAQTLFLACGLTADWGLTTVGFVILGIGIDIIEVARIQASYARFGERLLKRILHPNEIAYCLSHQSPAPFLAARFAAKEAISKAFGTGIGAQLGWQDMEVCRHDSGEPYVVLHGAGQELLRERGARRVLISLSHTQNHASAVAVLEGC
jgi:holo-[acyl-carrier protein] synthase